MDVTSIYKGLEGGATPSATKLKLSEVLGGMEKVGGPKKAKPPKPKVKGVMCAREDSNLHTRRHCRLKTARLPISPRAQ